MINYEEVFRQSPLSEVVFEARFPILLSIPQRIGDFQLSVMDTFEKAEEIRMQGIKIGTDEKVEVGSNMVWKFSHKDGDPTVTLHRNRIVVSSKTYKCYDSKEQKPFRPNIEYSVENFLDLFKIKSFSRIGLRYINECKMEELSNDWFKKFFRPILDIDKYPWESILEEQVILRFKKDGRNLLLQSGLIRGKGITKYLLDFDAYEENCEVSKYLETADRLHEVVLKEFHSLITDNYRNKLRGEQNVS